MQTSTSPTKITEIYRFDNISSHSLGGDDAYEYLTEMITAENFGWDSDPENTFLSKSSDSFVPAFTNDMITSDSSIFHTQIIENIFEMQKPTQHSLSAIAQLPQTTQIAQTPITHHLNGQYQWSTSHPTPNASQFVANQYVTNQFAASYPSLTSRSTSSVSEPITQLPSLNVHRVQLRELQKQSPQIEIPSTRPFKCQIPQEYLPKGGKKNTKEETPSKYQCTHCNKQFSQRCALHSHLRTHTGEKPFVCSYENCNKTFTEKTNLLTHERKHTGVQPFTCMVAGCNKSFTTKQNLGRHLEAHADIRQYCCHVCKKTFRQQSHVTAHKKTFKHF